MAGTVIADTLQAASTSTLVLKNGVASTPPTVQDSGGVEIGTFCRAWVNFNGTGTPAIRASFNVTSITDNGTGDYTVNFTNALPDANYCAQITVSSNTPTTANNGNQVNINSSSSGSLYTTSSFRMGVLRDNGGGTADTDPLIICAAIFR